MRIEDRIDFDHQPVGVWVKGKKRRQGRKESGRVREEKSWREVWNKEGCKMFRQKMERIKLEEKGVRVE